MITAKIIEFIREYKLEIFFITYLPVTFFYTFFPNSLFWKVLGSVYIAIFGLMLLMWLLGGGSSSESESRFIIIEK